MHARPMGKNIHIKAGLSTFARIRGPHSVPYYKYDDISEFIPLCSPQRL